MDTQLYQRMMETLAFIFNDGEFKWMNDKEVYLVTIPSESALQYPWAARNENFTKDEKQIMLSLVTTSNIFVNNGPRWYCSTNNFVEMKNKFLKSINYNLTNIDNRIIKLIPQY